jgi:hypothetical protein
MKPPTFITGRRAKSLQSPLKEAAKFLASVARQFVQDKVSASDVEVAITEWRGAVADEKARGSR